MIKVAIARQHRALYFTNMANCRQCPVAKTTSEALNSAARKKTVVNIRKSSFPTALKPINLTALHLSH